MSTPTWTRLRRAVASRGFTPATWIPAASEGRAEAATIRPARLVESAHFCPRSVGGQEPWPGVVAFLDGTQRYEVMAYGGSSPLVVAEIAAGVMERRERRLHVAEEGRRRFVIGRAEALEAVRDTLDGHETVPLPTDEPPHPVRDYILARRVVDQERGRLEVEVGTRYRRREDHWLIVDGSLTVSPEWAADRRMIGVSKSHATLPFEGETLEQYLRLSCGYRSPVFAPWSAEVAPVFSWGLRLWPWEGRDLLHGLIRLEAAPTDETIALADQISRWLLAERAPMSTPDPRWDRLLYGIREVEVYLKASAKR